MTVLSANETRALAYMEAVLVRTGGVSPSIREISRGIGLNSNSETHKLVTRLERTGHIRRVTPPFAAGRAKCRSIKVLIPVTAPRINEEPLRFIAVDELPVQNRPTISLSNSPSP